MPAPRQAMEPMPMPAPQNTEVQGLMDEIASLKAQIDGTQEPANAPVMTDAPVTTTQLDSIISGGGGANTSAGSNNFGDYRDEMENTPPERPDYYKFKPDLDSGFLQIQNPDAEGILKYGNDPKTLQSFKPQYDEYLNLFDRLKSRQYKMYKLTPEGRERQRQEEARFKELYNMFGVIGTGGAFSPMTTDSSMGNFSRDDMSANYVYSQFAIDQPERPIVEQKTFESPFPTPNLNIPNPMTGETPDGSPYQPQPTSTPSFDTLNPTQAPQFLQAPPELTNRMVGQPQPFEDKNVFELRQETESMANPYNELPTTIQIPPVTSMPQAIKQPSKGGISRLFGNTLNRVQKQIQAPQMPASMPASPMLQTRPAPFMKARPRNMLDIQQRFAPQRFADGGLSKALSELKTRVS